MYDCRFTHAWWVKRTRPSVNNALSSIELVLSYLQCRFLLTAREAIITPYQAQIRPSSVRGPRIASHCLQLHLHCNWCTTHEYLYPPRSDRRPPSRKKITNLQLRDIRIEQVPDILLVNFQVGYAHEEYAVGCSVHEAEQVARSHLHNARGNFRVLAALHRKSLSRRGLPVRENRAIYASDYGVHELACNALVDFLRRAVLVEDAVVREKSAALGVRQWVALRCCLCIMRCKELRGRFYLQDMCVQVDATLQTTVGWQKMMGIVVKS